MNITLDLETVGCNDPDLIAEITSKIKPPGSMKKWDTIQKWEAEERPQAVADAIAKTSLDGAYGRICVIGWAIDDEEPTAIVSKNEREVIAEFFSDVTLRLQDHPAGEPYAPHWIGHNLAGFDFPFLRKRCFVLGIKPPAALDQAMRSRQWDGLYSDTMLMWDTAKDKMIGIDLLCKVLKIPSPKAEGIDGSKVAELFAAGEYDALGRYCCDDVEATRRCWKAMTFQS